MLPPIRNIASADEDIALGAFERKVKDLAERALRGDFRPGIGVTGIQRANEENRVL